MEYHAFVSYFMIKRKSINVFLQMIEADLKLCQSIPKTNTQFSKV